MLNYIKSELYRLSHKRSMYVSYGSLFLIVTLILFFTQGQASTFDMSIYGGIMISMSIVFFGTQLYYAVYGDDYTHKTQSLIFSTCLSKGKYILSKLIVYMIMVAIIFGISAIYYYIICVIKVGEAPVFGTPEVNLVVNEAIIRIPALIGFVLVASGVTHFFQSANAGGILLPIMIVGLMNQILLLISNVFSWLEKPLEYLLSSQIITQTGKTIDGLEFDKVIYLVIIVYIISGLAISLFSLKTKDTQIN